MNHAPEKLDKLVDEYRTILHQPRKNATTSDDIPWDDIRGRLITECEWTPSAAQHLIELVGNYGAFILRNAAALAIALDVEDGEFRL